MKSIYKSSFLAILVIFLGINLSYGEIVSLSSSEKNQVNVTNNSFQTFTVTSDMAQIEFNYVQTEMGIYAQLASDHYASTIVPGEPALPVLKKLIEIPQGATSYVEVVNASYKDFTLEQLGINHPVFPYQPSLPKIKDATADFIYNAEAYAVDAFNTDQLAVIEEVGMMRAIRLGRLNIQPVQYNPVQGVLRIYTHLELKVVFENADYQATQDLKTKLYSPYFTKAYAQLLNYEPMQMRDEITQLPIKYVIVSDPMFQAALQPFVEWKTQKGYTVVEGYTDDSNVGNTTASIKAFLQDMYDNATTADPAPTFVLFVGDVDQIPVFNGSGHVTDLYYCEYNGDYIPEMYYGRFSATSVAELTPQIDKTLEYEKFEMPDPSYLSECVMIAGADASHAPTYGNGQIFYGVNYYFNDDHGLESHTYYYPESSSSSAQIIQNVSDGVSYANYTAHGNWDGWSDPSFNNSDVPGLQNEHKYCLMVGNCCLTNKFEQGSCFGETLLRAEGKGALGYIGGTNSTYWDEDYYWGVGVGAITASPTYESTGLGAYDRLFHDHGEAYADWFTTQGQQMYGGNLAVTEGGTRVQYYWEIYALMGDPSISVYMGVPSSMNVSYGVMPVGGDEFSVNAPAYSLVAISYNGDLKGTAQANSSGQATIHFDEPIMTAGEADIVVTGQNYEPFFGTVLLAGAPESATSPLPLNNKMNVSALTKLQWTDPSPVPAETFTLYLGTDNPPTNVLNGEEITTAFYQPDQLDYEKTYYWRVDSENEYGTAEGEVWTFATMRAPDENFETGGFGENPWHFGGDLAWSITQEDVFNGIYAARSGAISDNQTSSLMIDVNVTVFMSTVSFYKMVSSEGMTDVLEFYIDGNKMDSWGGLSGWSLEEYNLAKGQHELEWRYVKNESGAAGEDGAWVDYIYFPDPTTTTASAGGNGIVCSNESYQLFGTATLFNTIEWTTAGDGSFDDATILTPVYTPGDNDIQNGSVELTITVESSMKETVSDQMTLTIEAAPVAVAGSDSYICAVNSEMNVLAESDTANCIAMEWISLGDGSFDDANALHPSYTPGENDIAAGIVELVFAVEGNGPCGIVADTVLMEVFTTPAQALTPVIPADINTNMLPVVDVSVEEVDFAVSYEWMLNPENAGTITTSGEGVSCSIEWNTDFEGDIELSVRGLNGCGIGEYSEAATAFVYFSTGIEQQEALRFNVYPNPGNGLFTVNLNTDKSAEIQVYDMLGAQIFSMNATTSISQIDLSAYSEGVYFIWVKSGESTSVKRLLITK